MGIPELGQRKDARETARYINQLAKEMRTMAAEARLDFLAYLLAMVEDDAAATVQRLNGDAGVDA